jgi:hypothetical protein
MVLAWRRTRRGSPGWAHLQTAPPCPAPRSAACRRRRTRWTPVRAGRSSLLEYSEWVTRCRICLTSAWNDRVCLSMLAEQAHADGIGIAHQQQGVAVGGGLGRGLAGHDASGAGPVIHQHRLPQAPGHLLGHGAGRQVGNATWAEGHQQGDRPVGKARLRWRQARCSTGQHQQSRAPRGTCGMRSRILHGRRCYAPAGSPRTSTAAPAPQRAPGSRSRPSPRQIPARFPWPAGWPRSAWESRPSA